MSSIWLSKTAHKVPHKIHPQRPTGSEVAEDPSHIRHAGKHHAAVIYRIVPVHRGAVDLKWNVAHDGQIEARADADDVSLDLFTAVSAHTRFGKGLNGICDHGDFAGASRLKEVAVGAEREALLPWPIAWSEVRIKLKVIASILSHQCFELFEDGVRFVLAALGKHVLVVQNLRSNHSMDGGFVDTDFAHAVCQLVAILAAEKVGGERCSMVTCLAFLANSGTTVAAVAPEPITSTFLSV